MNHDYSYRSTGRDGIFDAIEILNPHGRVIATLYYLDEPDNDHAVRVEQAATLICQHLNAWQSGVLLGTPSSTELPSSLTELLNEANEAFWGVIGEAFPEATTGDFAPDATLEWDLACETAVKRWIRWNLPFDAGFRFRLSRDVERFPYFVAREGSTGTVVINNDYGIWAKMDQPTNGATEWDNEIHWESPIEFIDDIDPLREAGG